MSENGSDSDKSQIVITFESSGAANFESVNFTNVSAHQLLGAAEWIKWQALKILDADLLKRAQKQIQISTGALNDLKRGPH